MRTIGLISPGDMGQAVGVLLIEGGVRLVTGVSRRSDRVDRFRDVDGIVDVLARATEKAPTK